MSTEIIEKDAGLKPPVARLVDMDTREVSLVDKAANKRTFLIIKRDGSVSKAGDDHKNPDGTFQGGFDGCVAWTEDSKGLGEERARALCAYIGRQAGKIKSMGKAEGGLLNVLDAVESLAKACCDSCAKGQVCGTAKRYEALAEEVFKSIGSPGAQLAEQFNVGPDPKLAKMEEQMTQAQANGAAPAAPVTKAEPVTPLKKFKGAVSVLKEGLSDLKAGNVSVEKIKKASGELAEFIHTETAKAQYARDGRGVTPFAPNVGSGVQPDVSTVADVSAVFGEGSPSQLGEVMKRLDQVVKSNDELRSDLKKRDETISKLSKQVVTIQKTRVAPSTGYTDEDAAVIGTKESDDPVAWARDMADERSYERD